MLQAGYGVAYRAAQEYPAVQRVDLRIAAQTGAEAGNPRFDYLFIGSLAPESLLVSPESVRAADLSAIYRHVWWNPDIPL